MGANTEMSRLDSIPTAKLNALLGLDTVTLDEIPAPTADDNGKVLGVADGAYALVSGGGSGNDNIVVVNFEWDNTINKYRADKKDSEIEALINDGKTVIGRTSDGSYTCYGRYFYSMSFTGENPPGAYCEQLKPTETDYVYEVVNASWAVTIV